MWRKSLFISSAAVLSTAGLLLVVGPTLAGGLGQGQNLYQWSGGGLGGSTQPSYAVPYSAPVVAPAAGYQSFYSSPAAGYQSFYYSPATGYQSFYYAPPANASDSSVHIRMQVPADARIWFDDEGTQQTGSLRQFISPPLQPGKNYTYKVRARWMEDGRQVTRDRTVTVHAGDQIHLSFAR